jgi:hypothetical protein
MPPNPCCPIAALQSELLAAGRFNDEQVLLMIEHDEGYDKHMLAAAASALGTPVGVQVTASEAAQHLDRECSCE